MKKNVLLFMLLLAACMGFAKNDKNAQKAERMVEKEEERFQKELDKMPNSAVPYVNHADRLAEFPTEAPRAGSFYALALRFDSTNAGIYKNYGKYLLEKTRSVYDAKKMLQKSLSLKPDDEATNKLLETALKAVAALEAEEKLHDFGTVYIKELNPAINYKAATNFDSLQRMCEDALSKWNYSKLLNRYLADDTSLTPEEMYLLSVSFAKQTDYNPFRYTDITTLRMIAAHSVDTAIKKGYELIATNPLNPSLNREMMYYYRKKNDTVMAQKFRKRIQQYFNGMLFSGNGTCDKPYVCLWAKEEYNFLTYIGQKATETHYMGNCQHQMVEIIEAVDPAVQKNVPQYFNVALIYRQAAGK
jgi:tetratricopeptide (TPR) repeat protein